MKITLTEDQIKMLEAWAQELPTKYGMSFIQFHRHVVSAGDDYSNEDESVQKICAAIHTEELIAAYKESQKPLIV